MFAPPRVYDDDDDGDETEEQVWPEEEGGDEKSSENEWHDTRRQTIFFPSINSRGCCGAWSLTLPKRTGMYVSMHPIYVPDLAFHTLLYFIV